VFPLGFQQCEKDGLAVDRTGASHRDPEWISTGVTPPHGFAPQPLDGFTRGGKKPQIAYGRREIRRPRSGRRNPSAAQPRADRRSRDALRQLNDKARSPKATALCG
jgi:hypothetical protein